MMCSFLKQGSRMTVDKMIQDISQNNGELHAYLSAHSDIFYEMKTVLEKILTVKKDILGTSHRFISVDEQLQIKLNMIAHLYQDTSRHDITSLSSELYVQLNKLEANKFLAKTLLAKLAKYQYKLGEHYMLDKRHQISYAVLNIEFQENKSALLNVQKDLDDKLLSLNLYKNQDRKSLHSTTTFFSQTNTDNSQRTEKNVSRVNIV